LISLCAQNNEISLLPPEIGNVAALKFLNLQNNKLIDIPGEILYLKNLVWLSIRNNPGNESSLQLGREGEISSLFPGLINNLSDLSLTCIYNNFLSKSKEILTKKLPVELLQRLEEEGTRCIGCGGIYYGKNAPTKLLRVTSSDMKRMLLVRCSFCSLTCLQKANSERLKVAEKDFARKHVFLVL